MLSFLDVKVLHFIMLHNDLLMFHHVHIHAHANKHTNILHKSGFDEPTMFLQEVKTDIFTHNPEVT